MDIGALMKQAKKMQKDLAEVESKLQEKVYEASVSNGAVKVVVTGRGQLEQVTIDEALVEKDNKEILEDMIVMAVNDALGQMNKEKEETMGSLTGGMKMPGMF